MIFIASSCVGARMYEQLNIQFNNPFCWHRISYKHFLYLVDNLHNINFNNVKVSLINDPREQDNNNKVGLIKIDDKIDILYPHYIQDHRYKKPTKIDINVYYNKIEEYVLEKYTNRLKRMNLDDEIYLILCHNTDRDGFNVYSKNCKDFIKRNLPYNKILVTDDSSILYEPHENTNIIICDKHESTGNVAKKIISSMHIKKH